jgi:hypothetical protein
MPRRNHTPLHIRYDPTSLAHTTPKKPFASKHLAEQAIKELQKYHFELTLHTYRSPVDGKWYLSSNATTDE